MIMPGGEIDVVSCSPTPSEEAGSSSGGDATATTRRSLSSSCDDSDAQLLHEKKYYCQRCLNHDLHYPRKGHKPFCSYATCDCEDCSMVEQRRQLNNMLSRKRLQMPTMPRETINGRRVRDPQCARCGAHGVKIPLRGHKKSMCQFATCTCQLCALVENRRTLMAKQIKLRRDQQRQRDGVVAVSRRSSDREKSVSPTSTDSCVTNVTPSPPLGVGVNVDLNTHMHYQHHIVNNNNNNNNNININNNLNNQCSAFHPLAVSLPMLGFPKLTPSLPTPTSGFLASPFFVQTTSPPLPSFATTLPSFADLLATTSSSSPLANLTLAQLQQLILIQQLAASFSPTH